MKNDIRFLVMDVDGTLTDGKIYMGSEGELFKAFDIKDGYALCKLLPDKGIVPVVLTARTSQMVHHRCDELGIKTIIQGRSDKLSALKETLRSLGDYDLSNVAYIGDDILDLQCMEPILQTGGLVGCPSDAIDEVKSVASFVSSKKGGEGAVREFVEWLIAGNESLSEAEIEETINNTIDYIRNLDLDNLALGSYKVNDRVSFVIKYQETSAIDEIRPESHAFHIDIQWVLEGEALFAIQQTSSAPNGSYLREGDVQFWNPGKIAIKSRLSRGDFIVIREGQIHLPCIGYNNCKRIKILVAKISTKKD